MDLPYVRMPSHWHTLEKKEDSNKEKKKKTLIEHTLWGVGPWDTWQAVAGNKKERSQQQNTP